jgi:hypothetical protein
MADLAQANDEPVVVEPRWPIALAVSAFIAITITLRVREPHRESLGPTWLVPGIERRSPRSKLGGTTSRRRCGPSV